jgi:PAS domain S-box-containing protein
VVLVSLLVALILASRLQRVISEPILALAKITASVARQQNYSVRAKKPSKDEIGTLYDGFNEMLAEIQQRDAALQVAHRELEKRVNERTADLTEAHGLLKSELEERARAEEALRVSQQKLEALVNSIDGLVWEANPETFQFTFVSEQAERLLGYPRSHWTEEKDFWKEHLLPEDRHRAIEFFRQAVATQKAHHFEYRMRAADGRILWIRDSATLVREPGRPAVLRGVLQDITEQKNAEQELDTLNKQLMETSRQAGMAEVATGVLHNVGNVLNSVNVSATLVCDRVRRSKIPSLRKAADLINQNLTDLPTFLSSNKGRLLPSYLTELASKLADEQGEIQAELESLSKNIEHIKDIVSMQQSYARVSGVVETLDVRDLIEDSLQFNAAAYARHGVEVIRDYDGNPRVCVDKHKVLQILINLFNNAKYAMEKNGPRPKRLVIGLKQKPGRNVIVTITDNGMGIAKENINRVFNHGFTTRKDGHGFGLHSGALAAKEMGGSLTAYSGGPGAGATFTLELPVANAQAASIAA